MFTTIVFTFMFISFASLILYNLLSANNNLIISAEADIINKELNFIKQKLILSAKPILNENEYALPFGENDLVSHTHLLPADLQTPLKNIKGYYFQYCPYGYFDSTPKNDTLTVNENISYNVSLRTISNTEYVVYSDQRPITNVNDPIIKALIISKFNDDIIDCNDVLYNSENNKYYLPNAKVEYISQDEISTYYRFSNLSTQTENIILNNSNYIDSLNSIKNDPSNKSYYVELSENINIADDYSFLRKPSKFSNLEINLNGFDFIGNQELSFDNMNLYIYSNSGNTLPVSVLSNYLFNSSKVKIKDLEFGGIKLIDSELYLDNSLIYSNANQKVFNSYNSKITFHNNIYLISNNSIGYNSLVDLSNSDLTISNDSTVQAETKNAKINNIINLEKSDVFLSGEFTHIGSNINTYTTIFIGSKSSLFLDGGVVNTLGLGNVSDLNYDIDVRGSLSSGGSQSSINMLNDNNKDGIISVSYGGELLLNNILIGANGSRGIYTISEEDIGSSLNGASMLSGDSSVIITKGSSGCWNGYSFKNPIDGTTSQTNSGTSKENNTTDWTCL